MATMYFEDFEVGQRFTTSTRMITEKDIEDFVKLTRISSPLFLNDDFAKEKGHGGRIAPGPLTFSFSMGLFTQMGLFEESIIAFLGMDGMRLSAPVKPGDTIQVQVEISELKKTKKPGNGVVKEKYEVTNQRDDIVMKFEMAHLVKLKEGPPE